MLSLTVPIRRALAILCLIAVFATALVAGGALRAPEASAAPSASSTTTVPKQSTTTKPPKVTTTTLSKQQLIDIWNWYAEINRQLSFAAAMKRLVAWMNAQRQAAAAYPHGQCGGDLPPCYVMMRESRGDIHAQNPRSTASGKWQFLDSTWARFRGYAKARYAPESVQDAKARLLWNRGRGCSHWNAC